MKVRRVRQQRIARVAQQHGNPAVPTGGFHRPPSRRDPRRQTPVSPAGATGIPGWRLFGDFWCILKLRTPIAVWRYTPKGVSGVYFFCAPLSQFGGIHQQGYTPEWFLDRNFPAGVSVSDPGRPGWGMFLVYTFFAHPYRSLEVYTPARVCVWSVRGQLAQPPQERIHDFKKSYARNLQTWSK